MKHLKTLLLVAILTLGFTTTANAQKVAHIDTDKLIASMPASKALQAEMQKLQKSYKDEITREAKRLDSTYKKYQAEAKSQTQEVNKKRALEMQAGQQKLAQLEKAAIEEMQKKQQDKLIPILERAQKAIKDVAAEKGIIYVLDASRGKGLIVFDKGEDLYPAVKAKLGF